MLPLSVTFILCGRCFYNTRSDVSGSIQILEVCADHTVLLLPIAMHLMYYFELLYGITRPLIFCLLQTYYKLDFTAPKKHARNMLLYTGKQKASAFPVKRIHSIDAAVVISKLDKKYINITR